MIRFALANLFSRPGRTLLATFGLTIAIAGMVGLFAIAGGIDAMLHSSLSPIPGIVVLQAGAPIPLFSVLPASWEDELARIEGVGVVTPEVWTRVNLLDGKPVLSPPRLLMGVDPVTRGRLTRVWYEDYLEQGRFLDEQDAGRPHVLISRQIAQQTGRTVGQRLSINGREMTIVGIYHSGSLILDVTIISDITVVRELARMDSGTVNAFYVEPAAGVSTPELVARIQQAPPPRERRDQQASHPGSPLPPLSLPDLLSRWVSSVPPEPTQSRPKSHASNDQGDGMHNPDTDIALAEKRFGDFVTVTPVAEWGDRFSELTSDLDLVLALLTGLGMAIALSSILNTMMMSVTERTVEFGVLRANGWSQWDVVRLIVWESALVGVAGGLLGVLCGWTATHVVNHAWPDRVQLYAGPLLLGGSLVFSVSVGILGGLYPAFRAARLSPMDAIRRG